MAENGSSLATGINQYFFNIIPSLCVNALLECIFTHPIVIVLADQIYLKEISPMTTIQPYVGLPHLWTHSSTDEQYELQLGSATPTEMEKHHQIKPLKKKPVVRNPNIFDPLKVSVLLSNGCLSAFGFLFGKQVISM